MGSLPTDDSAATLARHQAGDGLFTLGTLAGISWVHPCLVRRDPRVLGILQTFDVPHGG